MFTLPRGILRARKIDAEFLKKFLCRKKYAMDDTRSGRMESVYTSSVWLKIYKAGVV